MHRTAAVRLARLLARQGWHVRLRRVRPRRGPAYWLVERTPSRQLPGDNEPPIGMLPSGRLCVVAEENLP